ncbi:hypothetical protein JOQ06_007452 [Pogonophryne albipinna]|uniref:Uncharacterized protein n=1 Tax=Pogonophryne albipinna TaxID=1090488 RepID=A0AAD6B0R8_9TELE|nr:hypothetical protein JOQ06_007452 [Pogonophryne albipinna]
MSEDIKLEIQTAHRAPAPKPQPDKPPRAIIVNFLRFEVKENVIKTAWRTAMEVKGRRVTFDHDYSSEVAVKRRKYAGLKKCLKDKGIRFQSPMDTLRRPTLLQRLEAARKWTRLRRQERGDNNEMGVREDRHRNEGVDE